MRRILSITLERTPCYGPCPVFEARLRHGGAVEYRGDYAVEPTGAHAGTLPRGSFARLAALVEAHGFFALRAEYAPDPMVTDLPSRVITVETEQGTKRVSDYGMAGPAALHRLERAITGRLRRLGLARPAEWPS